jgi:hypothetical protein
MNAPVRDFLSHDNSAVAWHPGKLWSLWDMRVYAHRYIALGERIHDMRALFIMRDGDEPFKSDHVEALKNNFKELIKLCESLDMPVAKELLSTRLTSPPQSEGEFNILIDALRAELKAKLFIFIPADRAKHYATDQPEKVLAAFPSASKEMRMAGNCFACGVFTASVFHSMRAAEIGVRAMATELGVTFPFDMALAEWHNILDQIDNKIKEMKSLPKGTKKDEDLQFYSEAASQFRFFKDGWRIRVSHARATYGQSDSLRVLDHVKDFFTTLSTRLTEPGV